MSTHDNAPPPDGWCCEPRPCPCFDRAEPEPSIPPGVVLGEN